MLDRLSADARASYRGLVYESSAFLDYFREATPIEAISELRLGSRPARRSASARVEELRAIPWVFSWTQNRHGLPGWFGLGAACGTAAGAERPQRGCHAGAGFHLDRHLTKKNCRARGALQFFLNLLCQAAGASEAPGSACGRLPSSPPSEPSSASSGLPSALRLSLSSFLRFLASSFWRFSYE